MTFWQTQLGPCIEKDIPVDSGDQRLIGEIFCPECDNILARLHDRAEGVGLTSWMRGSSVANPQSLIVGYAFFSLVTAAEPADDEAADLVCWRGHGDLRITGADCRAVIDRYRGRGRKIRHPATRVPHSDGEPSVP
ncbi:hypothetical protein [Amycolatopsis saalfeldensis]|uniref:Uncharacterized protein n=1 Tax=Amycolatopsis saalfeldensis TaxID=394193 RepID=A0A1H8YNC9_9PSEU|nr:hypothetical protein [Amycolatopsis saalfeldensis]SEP53593.1 hypothetical protein SAMN04489732_12918 [Amycolatopsis saalfeldensis]